ncbi:MAG: phosphatidate cytidylyltransferase, partial [Brachymonas sp.]|nr:phosphatidate cytidylyltransferase [Brachymonas sp.]
VYGMSYVPALLLLQYADFKGRSAFLVFFLIMAVQVCMLVQALVARHYPSKPLAPNICTSFGWKNWAAGLAAGAVTGGVFSVFTPLHFGHGLLMGLIAGLAGSLGHFVMKAIKRDRGITNWGNLGRSVLGTGGLLDKVDALCFAAPVFFHVLVWLYPATIV